MDAAKAGRCSGSTSVTSAERSVRRPNIAPLWRKRLPRRRGAGPSSRHSRMLNVHSGHLLTGAGYAKISATGYVNPGSTLPPSRVSSRHEILTGRWTLPASLRLTHSDTRHPAASTHHPPSLDPCSARSRPTGLQTQLTPGVLRPYVSPPMLLVFVPGPSRWHTDRHCAQVVAPHYPT
jgi:hypothetical protein